MNGSKGADFKPTIVSNPFNMLKNPRAQPFLPCLQNVLSSTQKTIGADAPTSHIMGTYTNPTLPIPKEIYSSSKLFNQQLDNEEL